MRIITGLYKGRILKMPDNNKIRPTTEKVKEAIFSSIMYYVEDSIFCDLFSGTGSLGLEALSRGAKHCYFCDAERTSIAITKNNIAMCKAEDKATVYLMDFENALNRLKENKVKIDVFLCDPPYKMEYYDRIVNLIKEYDLLNDDGIILLEHDSRDKFPDEYYGFKKLKEKIFGNVSFTIYY